MDNLSHLKDQNPINILKDWLHDAEKHPAISNFNAMVLSTPCHIPFTTITLLPTLRVTSRVVLLKEILEDKLIFYTNYKSLKYRRTITTIIVKYFISFGERWFLALNFYWPALNRQVRLEGIMRKTSRETTLKYWKTRSKESQISQYISQQSQKLEDRQALEKKWQTTYQEFTQKEVPCPTHWGGVAFDPHLIEFWMEKPHRLHDRLVFKRSASSIFAFQKRKSKWKAHLLYP